MYGAGYMMSGGKRIRCSEGGASGVWRMVLLMFRGRSKCPTGNGFPQFHSLPDGPPHAQRPLRHPPHPVGSGNRLKHSLPDRPPPGQRHLRHNPRPVGSGNRLKHSLPDGRWRRNLQKYRSRNIAETKIILIFAIQLVLGPGG